MQILLQKKYSELLTQPVNQIYRELKSVYKHAFADNERILFIDDVEGTDAKSNLEFYLDKLLDHLDIDRFFIQTVNRGSQTIANPTNYHIPDSVCITPWLSLEVDVDSKLHRCCLWDREKGTTSDSLVEYFKSTEQVQLKQDFLQGKRPDACNKCWQLESAGGTSKRLADNYVFRDHKFDIDYNDTTSSRIVNLDIKLGNKCNLACRICGPRCSSTWSRFADAVTVEFNWLENESSAFWSDIIDISEDVKYITFAGGEPLLDKTHRKLLQYFIDTGLSEDIALHYNTNGTVFADFLFDYWDQFKSVELSFSIDAVGKRFEYERFGMIWDKVHANLQRYSKTDYTCNLYATLTALNVMYSDEIYEYSEQLGCGITYNLLTDPEDLAVTNLPVKTKLHIKNKLLALDINGFKEKITPVISMMETKSSISSLQEFLLPQDFKRAQRFEDYYPELHSEITKCQ